MASLESNRHRNQLGEQPRSCLPTDRLVLGTASDPRLCSANAGCASRDRRRRRGACNAHRALSLLLLFAEYASYWRGVRPLLCRCCVLGNEAGATLAISGEPNSRTGDRAAGTSRRHLLRALDVLSTLYSRDLSALRDSREQSWNGRAADCCATPESDIGCSCSSAPAGRLNAEYWR